jgi:hypothetical protein
MICVRSSVAVAIFFKLRKEKRLASAYIQSRTCSKKPYQNPLNSACLMIMYVEEAIAVARHSRTIFEYVHEHLFVLAKN